jgi:hypothetical protein
MTSKSVSYKIKWLLTGLFSGIFVTIFMPQFLSSNRVQDEQKNDILGTAIPRKFADYSQWPPFLTDPSFDLVK